jgi:nucleoside-diphosphate-sugar epimerase
MRVLVTGAGGFIGSQVVSQLALAGHQTVAIDRDPAAASRAARETPAVAFRAVDLSDFGAVRGLLHDVSPEVVIHLAGYAHPKDYLASHANLPSLTMTNSLVEEALAAGCRKLVMGGSCAEYAAVQRPLVESDPVEPLTLYAACKHAAHQIARILSAETGTALAWARIFHIHGPGENPSRLIPWVANQIRAGVPVPLTDGTQVRDHLHVADVAAALVTLAVAPGANGTYNICSGQPVTLRQVLETVGDILDGRHLLQFGKVPHGPNESPYLAGDSSRLRALGWAPRFGLRDGLTDALRGKF